MKQKRPFQVTIANSTKVALRDFAAEKGVPYGIFFSTSGKALIEPVNRHAKHNYVFRTDQ